VPRPVWARSAPHVDRDRPVVDAVAFCSDSARATHPGAGRQQSGEILITAVVLVASVNAVDFGMAMM